MPRLSLGVSTNSGSNRAAVAPAPSGFPNVGANGQQIYVSGYYEYTGIYTKVSSGYEVGFVAASRVYNGPYIINGDFFAQLIFNTSVNRWEFGGVADWTGNGYEWLAVISNPSSNQNVIPTSGWSSAITIVPSGIPVASTASFLILWATYIYSYNYRTMSRLEPNQTIDIGYASWNSGPNRNYRLESSYQIELIAPGNLSTIGGSAGYLISLNGPKNYWRLIRVSTNCSDGECDTNVEESINFTNFTNPEYFPDTGYPNGFSYTL